MGRVARPAFIVLLAAVMTAIVVQDFTDAVPSELFNTGRHIAAAFSLVSLALCAVALVVLLLDIGSDRPPPLSAAASAVRAVIAGAVALELLVAATDVFLMSRSPDAPLGGPYYEMQARDGEWLILKKRGGVPPFGFRAPAPYGKVSDRYRVLFLGDSFTEGSGRRPGCNYPTVVESGLAARANRPVEVMNAGVSGYGPDQARILLGELFARGYTADAVVYNFLVENDFTDNPPGTVRRVVAGMGFRFPRSWFLRTFHPVNTRTFRTAMFLRSFIRIRYQLDDLSAISDEPCDLTPRRLDALPPSVENILLRTLDGVERAAASPRLQRGALESIRAIQREVEGAGIPFAVVVFPHRAAVDPDARRLLGADPAQLAAADSLCARVIGSLDGVPVVDTSPALAGRPGMYRRVDTHLSDLGNLVVGEWVARRLDGIVVP